MKKICVLGTQRSGSQYVCKLIENVLNSSQYSNVVNISEIFTFKIKSTIELENNLLSHLIETTFEYNNEEEHINAMMELIRQGDVNQPVVIKLFFLFDNNKLTHRIIEFLKELDFIFIKLKRTDVEKQILSFIIAQKTDVWNSRTHQTYQKVTITDFSHINYIFNNIVKFEDDIKMFGMENIPTIIYENAENDLKKLFSVDFIEPTSIWKTGLSNPYDQIENAEEVKAFIQNLLHEPSCS